MEKIKKLRKGFKELKKRLKYLFTGTSKVKASYAFTSHLKVEDLPKGKWAFVVSQITVDEANNTFLEECEMMCNTKDKIEKFKGDISAVTIHERRLTTKETRTLNKMHLLCPKEK